MTIRCKVHNTSIIFGLKIFILPEPVYFLLVHHISKYIEFIWREKILFAYKNSSIVIQSNVPESRVWNTRSGLEMEREAGAGGNPNLFLCTWPLLSECRVNFKFEYKWTKLSLFCGDANTDWCSWFVMLLILYCNIKEIISTHPTLLIKSTSIETEPHLPQSNIVFPRCVLVPASLLSRKILILAEEGPACPVSSQCLPEKLRGPRGNYGWPEY